MFNGKNHSMIYKVLSLVFGGIIILFIFLSEWTDGQICM